VKGILQKMKTRLNTPVEYELPIGTQSLPLNSFLGAPFTLSFSGKIFCLGCGGQTKKSFNQGYCYRCFISLAACDMCIVKPELCSYFRGGCREPAWGEKNCLIPHIVYLANSSGLKVGITREVNLPHRWIDQGAIQALPIARVPNRLSSGVLEVKAKNLVADKTNWQVMLKGHNQPINFMDVRSDLLHLWGEADSIEIIADPQAIEIQYPVLEYPLKITSLNPEKAPVINGILLGIKGQYLIFDKGVINIRKFGGYEVEIAL
jgi:hypothetical protein